jgi:hypothetical protein
VVHADGCSPNFSPLRNVHGVRFIGTSDQLLATLEEIPAGNFEPRSESQKFFTIDSELPRWRRYFESVCLGGKDDAAHDDPVPPRVMRKAGRIL